MVSSSSSSTESDLDSSSQAAADAQDGKQDAMQAGKPINTSGNLPLWKRCWFFPLLLVLFGAVIYAPAVWGVFVLDDRSHIAGSTRFASFFPLSQYLHRRGLMDITLAFNYAVDGLNPRGYHFLNILIHLLASIVLYDIIRRLLMLPQWSLRLHRSAKGLAFVIAAIWMAHPLQTQAVSYVIQRGESMAGLFVLLSAWTLVRIHFVNKTSSNHAAKTVAWATACVVAMVCALWTKETAVTAPVALLLLDRCLLAGTFAQMFKRRWWLHVLLIGTMALPFVGGVGELELPFVNTSTPVSQVATSQSVDGAGGAAGASGTSASQLTTWVHPQPLHVIPPMMKMDHFLAAGFALPGTSPKQYFFTQPAVICFYLKQTFWPSWLSLEHNWRPMRTPWAGWRVIDLQLAFGFLVTLAVLSLWALWRRPWLGLAGCWFFLSLGVSSSFIPINDLAVEHRMYLALLSVVSVVVLGGWQLVGYWSEKGVQSEQGSEQGSVQSSNASNAASNISTRARQLSTVAAGLACVVIVALGARTMARNVDYQSELALWEGAASGQVPNIRVHVNLGSSLYEAGHKERAQAEYEKALLLRPGDSNSLMNLGSIRFNQRDLQGAERFYKESLRMSPRSVTAMVFLSRIERLRNNVPGALAYLQQADAADPDNAAVLESLANMQFQLKQYDAAANTYQKIFAIQGPTAAMLTNLGMVRVAQNQLVEASALFTQATQVDPQFIHSWEQLARNEARQGHFKESLAALRQAIAVEPSMRLQQQLAMLLAHSRDPQVKNIPEAMMIVEQGLQMTRRQDPAWLEVAAKVAMAAGRPRLALQAEIDALAIARQRGITEQMAQQGEAEIARLRAIVNQMESAGTSTPSN